MLTSPDEEQAKVMTWVSAAVHEVRAQQPELWSGNLGERARVAEIFVVLRDTDPFEGYWRIDFEWNKEGTQGDSKVQEENNGGIGTPDLIVHHRGKKGRDHNLLVAEFKNVSRLGKTNLTDLNKVKYWMKRFEYRFGAVIALGPGPTVFGPSGRWLNLLPTGKITNKTWAL